MRKDIETKQAGGRVEQRAGSETKKTQETSGLKKSKAFGQVEIRKSHQKEGATTTRKRAPTSTPPERRGTEQSNTVEVSVYPLYKESACEGEQGGERSWLLKGRII